MEALRANPKNGRSKLAPTGAPASTVFILYSAGHSMESGPATPNALPEPPRCSLHNIVIHCLTLARHPLSPRLSRSENGPAGAPPAWRLSWLSRRMAHREPELLIRLRNSKLHILTSGLVSPLPTRRPDLSKESMIWFPLRLMSSYPASASLSLVSPMILE